MEQVLKYYYISKYPIISESIFDSNIRELEIALTKASAEPEFLKKHIDNFQDLSIVSYDSEYWYNKVVNIQKNHRIKVIVIVLVCIALFFLFMFPIGVAIIAIGMVIAIAGAVPTLFVLFGLGTLSSRPTSKSQFVNNPSDWE